jgi:hypothetical protein
MDAGNRSKVGRSLELDKSRQQRSKSAKKPVAGKAASKGISKDRKTQGKGIGMLII